jgi:hypothetical protein
MATIVNNPSGTERVVERERLVDNGSDGAGWAVAIIILVAVIAVGAYLWTQYQGSPAPADNGGTNIEVNIPTPGGPTPEAGGASNGSGVIPGPSSFSGSLSGSSTASNTRSGTY